VTFAAELNDYELMTVYRTWWPHLPRHASWLWSTVICYSASCSTKIPCFWTCAWR